MLGHRASHGGPGLGSLLLRPQGAKSIGEKHLQGQKESDMSSKGREKRVNNAMQHLAGIKREQRQACVLSVDPHGDLAPLTPDTPARESDIALHCTSCVLQHLR